MKLSLLCVLTFLLSNTSFASCEYLYKTLSKNLDSLDSSSITFKFQSRQYNPKSLTRELSKRLESVGIQSTISDIRPKETPVYDLSGMLISSQRPAGESRLFKTPYSEIEIEIESKKDLYNLVIIYDSLGIQAQKTLVGDQLLDKSKWLDKAFKILEGKDNEASLRISFNSYKKGLEFLNEARHQFPLSAVKNSVENIDGKIISYIDLSVKNKTQMTQFSSLVDEFGYKPLQIQVVPAVSSNKQWSQESLLEYIDMYLDATKPNLSTTDYQVIGDYFLTVLENPEFRKNAYAYIQYLKRLYNYKTSLEKDAVEVLAKMSHSEYFQEVLNTDGLYNWYYEVRYNLYKSKATPVKVVFFETDKKTLSMKMGAMMNVLKNKQQVDKIENIVTADEGKIFRGEFTFDILLEEQMELLKELETEFSYSVKIFKG